MGKSKRERFITIAENRTNKVIDTLRLLANCANKASYEYDEADVKQIFSAIDKELKSTKNAFLGVEPKERKFVFKDHK